MNHPHLPGGELHLEEAGKDVNDKNHGVFMWGREDRLLEKSVRIGISNNHK